MPIYEFRCESCGHYEEKLMKISDPLEKTCPECGKSTFEKLLSKTSFILKGQGWYETDFKKPSSSSPPSSSSSASSSTSSVPATSAPKSEPAKPETKPAPKSETAS